MKKILLSLTLLSALSIHCQTINLTEIEMNFKGDSYPKNFTKGITKMYFSADDEIDGEELWVHDLVTNKTHLVKDIGNNNDGLYNSKLMTIGDILYFTVNPGSQLWRSDGTEAGTYLVKMISNTIASNNTITELFNYNGMIVFNAYDPVHGKELWISNGTEAGTTLLKDIRTGPVSSFPYNFFIFNGNLFFIADDGINGTEIWKSDGTVSGTTLLRNINDGSLYSLNGGQFIVLNDAFYFYAGDNTNGFELWKSDGTSSGTSIFKDIETGSSSSGYSLIGAGTSDYFIFEITSSIGTELWKCDGTVAGTMLLKDINPGSGSSVNSDTEFTVLNGKIYFNALTPSNGTELWVTDGTSTGTQLVKDIRTGTMSSNIYKLTTVNNYLIFSAQGDSRTYPTLWKSDGTNTGTFELKDIDLRFNSAGALSFLEFNDLVFFGAGYNTLNGNELWVTDGTTENTYLFKDIFHRYSGAYNFWDSTEINGKLIYTGNDGDNRAPFITDGTLNGTRKITPPGGNLFPSTQAFYTKAGSYVYFRATNSTSGYELWKTDGITTLMVKDINPGSGSSITEYPLFMVYNDILYFKADDGIHGEELWRTDGTESGTYMLKDIYPGSGYAFNGDSNFNTYLGFKDKCFAILNGYLYFTAFDGTDSSIWRTDGTEAGTVKAIVVPTSNSSDIRRVIVNTANDRIIFKTNLNNSGYGNDTLWSTDGTQAGTVMLQTSPNTAGYENSIVHDDILYHILYAGDGVMLVKTDGTVAGTSTVKENFTIHRDLFSFKSCGGFIYFIVGTGTKEIWRSNGTETGTVKLGDLSAFSSANCGCHQGYLLFKDQPLNEDKIYYANGNSSDASHFLTTHIVNSEDFGVLGNFIYNDFYSLNNKLLLIATKEHSGSELYSSEFNLSGLDNQDFVSEIKNTIVLYPNPAGNRLNFKPVNGEVIQRAEVFDLLGKKVFSSEVSNNELDLSNVGNGIHIIKITTDKSQYNNKLVVKK